MAFTAVAWGDWGTLCNTAVPLLLSLCMYVNLGVCLWSMVESFVLESRWALGAKTRTILVSQKQDLIIFHKFKMSPLFT